MFPIKKYKKFTQFWVLDELHQKKNLEIYFFLELDAEALVGS
jgi:hypothetical protein